MLDVHPPHAPTHTWRDFFVHIATITVGLLIAIGLEQTIEAVHHHHQREALEEQMHTESERNLKLVKTEISFATTGDQYFRDCLEALQSSPVSGDSVTVTLPLDHFSLPGGMLISPSQGTWLVARAAGTVALLPAEEAKVYTRLNLAADFEQASEIASGTYANVLASTRMRNHLPSGISSPARITITQRDELIYAFSQSHNSLADLKFRLVILEGALDAVLANVQTLEDMYPYQQRALARENAPSPINRATAPPAPTP
jgi:hypothetical protein